MPNDICPIQLHVVFSGRGDALILQYLGSDQQWKLILIDGGPLTYTVGKGPKPYWKYYLSAARQIWKNLGKGDDVPFSSDAIINTHAHDDHAHGLLLLLQSSLSRPGRAGPMTFNGTFYVPAARGVGSTAFVETYHQLLAGESNFRKFTPIFNPGINLNNMKCVWPEPQKILQFKKQDVPTAYDLDTFLNDFPEVGDEYEKDLNYASVLLKSNMNQNEDFGNLFLTGDNCGRVINEFTQKTTDKFQHFSIYKIQHHGSCIDNQMKMNRKHAPAKAIKEYKVYNILRRQTGFVDPLWLLANAEFHGWENVDGTPDLVARVMSKISLKKPNYGPDLRRDYLERLEARLEYCFTKCAEGRSGTEIFDGAPDMGLLPQADKIWTEVKADLDKLVENPDWPQRRLYLIIKPNARSNTTPALQDWWREYDEDSQSCGWAQPFITAMCCGPISDFFASFTADAYVVSANSVHNHPHPAMIVGLALALKKLNRAATLYVTSGSSLQIFFFAVAVFNNESRL